MANPDVGDTATMRAVVIDSFGGPEQLREREVPVPSPGPGQVLIRLEAAGVGSWDPFEREGGYAEMQGTSPSFPYVLGSQGAGTIAAIGEGVTGRAVGERVFAASFLNPTGGFYAEYVCVDAELVGPIPAGMSTSKAAVMGGVGMTALRGLQDALEVRSGETLLVHGASGAMGHLAVQLGKRLGARVLAVASGEDGVALAVRVGGISRSTDGPSRSQTALGASPPTALTPRCSPPEDHRPMRQWRPCGPAAGRSTPRASNRNRPRHRASNHRRSTASQTQSSLNGSSRSSATARSTSTSRASLASIRSPPHITPWASTT